MGKRQKLVRKKVQSLSDGSKLVEHYYFDTKKEDMVGYIQRFKNGKRVHSKKMRAKTYERLTTRIVDYKDAFKKKAGLFWRNTIEHKRPGSKLSEEIWEKMTGD